MFFCVRFRFLYVCMYFREWVISSVYFYVLESEEFLGFEREEI